MAAALPGDPFPRLADGFGAPGDVNVRLAEPHDMLLFRRSSNAGNKELVRLRGKPCNLVSKVTFNMCSYLPSSCMYSVSFVPAVVKQDFQDSIVSVYTYKYTTKVANSARINLLHIET